MEQVEFVALERVPELIGATRRTITRRIAQGELPVMVNPLDRRRKIVHVADLERVRGTIRQRAELAS